MEDEQKEILEGVIVDISRLTFEKRKKILGFSDKIVEKFSGDKPLSFKWIQDDPFSTEEVLTIATCEDGYVDADNIKLYEYISDLIDD